MCGICGIYDFSRGQPPDEQLLEQMNATLLHRGPDGGGVHLDGPAGLAARRLAIIDLAHGDQPMLAADGAGPPIDLFTSRDHDRSLRSTSPSARRRAAPRSPGSTRRGAA